MKKRMFASLLCLCMVFALLPSTALAADTVNLVTLTIDAPAVGKTPVTTATLQKNASTYVKSIDWAGDLDDAGKFQSGKVYTVTIALGIRDGVDRTFKTTKASLLTINGKEATIVSETDTELVLSYKFAIGSSAAADTSIATVDISITLPAAGNKPDNSPTVLANGAAGLIEVVNASWGGTFNQPDKTFKAGTGYTLSVRMEPAKSGYTFAKGVTATVNGLAAEVIFRADSTMMVKYQYKPTADEVTEAQRSERFSTGTYYTMAEAESIRTTGRDGMLVGHSVDALNALSQVEQRRLRAFVIDGHDVEGAKKLAYELHRVYNLFRVNEVWFGPEYTGEEVADIMFEVFNGNRYIIDATCSGHMMGNDSRFYISEATLKTLDTELDGRNVRVYKGSDVEAAAQRGAGDTYNWCKNHQFVGASFDAGTAYTYNDCTHIGRFYRVCQNCGECEKNPNQTVEWVVTGTRQTSGEPIHDYADRVVDSAYVGVDVNGQKVYYQSCDICGQVREKSALTANTALSGKAVAGMFRVSQTVSAKTSGWAQSGANDALQEGLVDAALLGGDYTKACTRLQFCSVAVRLTEKMTGKAITPAPASTFTDTQNEYVLKAYAAGITSGTSETTFSPDATLNRQQMAAFIYRALQYVKANSDILYTPYTSKLASYTDNGQLSSWAQEPMAFMNALGLISGTSATTLSPDSNCTVEQALIVAERSLNAHKIGWYIVRTDKSLRENWFNYCTFYTTAGAKTQYNYVAGEVIWMTDWRDSNKVGGDLITIDPESGLKVAATGDNFIPIREK